MGMLASVNVAAQVDAFLAGGACIDRLRRAGHRPRRFRCPNYMAMPPVSGGRGAGRGWLVVPEM